ncbi:pentatricopeptide repeat protein [Aspergillus saccharolyticus JOP 1030-1]|uniref:Pentatricopeptide repeat protein n=1 Tax=Aspergillus saccharolyticus JOP 1030-1 TaxID=1450539 RepID=A0A319A601_9EURO|nr:pentatricopeptide repeat protein [Aspergillus saccharolyticus JOP 1030-1]PYH47478.1 pentatricopeptide repeat protein [Aspergillus saccharolyticus JOP 1030-1]
MPPSTRFSSSPNLRPLSQPLDTCLSFHHSSMSKPDSCSYNTSLRRFASRRPRLNAASIADVFVGSLVIAGYCREHSPRGRAFSTLPQKSSRGNILSWQDRRSRQTGRRPSTHHFDSLTSAPKRLHQSRTQRMFNSGVALRVKENNDEDCPWSNSSLQGPCARPQGPNVTGERYLAAHEDLNRSSLKQHETTHTKKRTSAESEINQPARSDATKINTTVQKSDEKRGSKKYSYKGRTSPTKALHESVSHFYKTLFDDSLDWEQAADLVARTQTKMDSYSTPITPIKEAKSHDAEESDSIARLRDAIWDESKSNQYVFRLYRDLPYPGVAHLSKACRGALLRRFANPDNRRWVEARRFLALLDDMVDAKLQVSRALWTSAIHLAGRASGKVFKRDLVRSIGLWQKMEHWGGVKSDGVVFTILFDIAVKASQFTVADRLMAEMEERGLQFGRTGKVSRIYRHGQQHDVDGVRQAFDDFTSSGEIIDTAVMNCLMASFISAGDVKAAEAIYAQMMKNQAAGASTHAIYGNLSTDFKHYRERSKKLNRLLEVSASLKDHLPGHYRTIQEAVGITPDTRTYRILLSLYAHKTGDIEALMSVIADMEKAFAVPPRGLIYLFLFEGFAHHGRRREGWTADRLRVAWKTYLRALYESKSRAEQERHPHSGKKSPTWENPLLDSYVPLAQPPVPPAPTGLYTPLPLIKTRANVREPSAEEGMHTETNDIGEPSGGINKQIHEALDAGFPEEELERQIENGVFLGRRMIVLILRGFGRCCGPRETMEVWLQMERLWQPWKRRAQDVMAVKEELEKQMQNVRWR